MITPIELSSKSFNKSGLGYDKKDVDNFMRDVITSYETLYKENVELKDKINVLNEGIQYYKTIEKTLQKALVLAEQTAEETKEAARQRAKVIEDEAKVKASLLLEDAKRQLNEVHQKTIKLTQQYDLYKAQYRHLAATQMEILESDTFQIHIANLEAFVQAEESHEEEEDSTMTMMNINQPKQNTSSAVEEESELLPVENI